jgi:hypothetical protein
MRKMTSHEVLPGGEPALPARLDEVVDRGDAVRADVALAFASPRNVSMRSRTLSEVAASTERSDDSPRSYTQSTGSHWLGAGLTSCRPAWRSIAARILSMFTKVVMGFA